MKSTSTFLIGILLSFCLLLGMQPNAIASEAIDKTDTLASLEGYPRLEMALDQYLMAIPSGYYTILHSAGYLGQKIIFAGGSAKKLQN